MDRNFYVGALGWMRALPDVEAVPGVDPGRIGGSGSSMYGSQWRDTLGYAGVWSWKWKNLLPQQQRYVRALILGQVRQPLRLLDPRLINRLPPQVASGGSTLASSDGFGVSTGGLQYRDLLKVAPNVDTLPASDIIRGCQEWLRPNGGAGTCYLAGPELDGTWRAPFLPGEELRLSTWVAGLDGLTAQLRWIDYERDDTAHSYFSSSQTSSSVVLKSGVWQEVSLYVKGKARGVAGDTYTSASISPRLYTPDTAPGSIWHTGWMVREPDADAPPPGLNGPCVVPGDRTLWYPGGATPRVVVDPEASSYPSPGFYDAGLILTETTTP